MKIRNRVGLVWALGLAIGLGSTAAMGADSASTSEQSNRLQRNAMLSAFSQAFSEVAEESLPSVVTILANQSVPEVGFHQFYGDDPLREFFEGYRQ